MSTVKITDKVTSVGVINPNLRVFDIIMCTEHGTSYNAYLVKGKNKTALIECTHSSYFKHFMKNIKDTIGDGKIDYIVLNHCEPDHTGTLVDIIKEYPDAEIIASQAGAMYVKNITNLPDLNVRAVKNADQIDLGGLTLEFIPAPFLHWPDSMFTWLKEEKVLFSCDFLGAHYCEPNVFDYNVTYPKKYEAALAEYYGAIFAPFNKYVADGLEKIKDFDIEFACTSHGPVLTKNGTLSSALEKYHKWCKPTKREAKLIPVFYTSAYGNTALLAEAIAEGIKAVEPNAEVCCYDIIEHDMGTLGELINFADGFAIGSPTLNRDAVAPVWNLIATIDAINSAKKPVLVFGSYGWSGEAAANLTARLSGLKMAVYPDTARVIFTPSAEDLTKATQLGKDFAATIK